MSDPFLFEIGTEELPASFVEVGMGFLARELEHKLRALRLEANAIEAMGTPRRLFVWANGIPQKQDDVTEVVVGPPKRVAITSDGEFTKAAIGFARKNDVDVDSLRCELVDGKQGEYVVCTVRRLGKKTVEVLPEVLSALIEQIPWPKSMRWGSATVAFARPIHWLLAMYGQEVISLQFAGIQSSNTTRGHRFLAPQARPVVGGKNGYVAGLRDAFVIVSPNVRCDLIRAELTRVATQTACQVRSDEALIREVTNLVEYPVAVCGEFEQAYLQLPEQVIVSAMRSHQRYFAMEDGNGGLVNRFVTIAGTVTRDMEVVRRGNERVLAARLADAQFFYQEDLKTQLESMIPLLDGVVFQAKLGSVGDKVARIRGNAASLAERVRVDVASALRVASLCKADLVSQMVGEFPDLQGVMGRCYAREAGEPAIIADAIADHYLPRFSGDFMPTGEIGAVVAIADRIDTLVGCFAVGLSPTGSADPYGLRRAAVSLIAILLDRGWRVSLTDLVAVAAAKVASIVEVAQDQRAAICDFLVVRLRGFLIETRNLRNDCVDAVLGVGCDDVVDASHRAQALSELRDQANFASLAQPFKRVANILKGQVSGSEPEIALFSEPQEHRLWAAFGELRKVTQERVDAGDYRGSLQLLTELKHPVDAFFDAVLVMDEDPAIKSNRLALLSAIYRGFSRIADFRKLTV